MEAVELPPMLIQPYIENAVWHGLRYKNTKGHLHVHIKDQQTTIQVEITDNGIGRKRSMELKTQNQKKHHRSTGLKNIQERLSIINKVYKKNYQVSIQDLDPEAGMGTKVLVQLPVKRTTPEPFTDS